ncbi:MAG: hypothetical protein WBA76_09215 [Phormidesmis sp.]
MSRASEFSNFALEEATITVLQSAMARENISAASLVDYYLAKIKQCDGHLNAFICINEKAKETAAALDVERSHSRGNRAGQG